MSKWLKRFVFFVLLLVILLPVTASAESPTCPPACYASYNGTTTDLTDTAAGSYSKQWKATSLAEMVPYLEEAGRRIASTQSPGTFYWAVDNNRYWKYNINAQGEPISGNRLAGQPPESGVALPFPTLLIGLALLGAILLVAGYLLRSRLFQASRP